MALAGSSIWPKNLKYVSLWTLIRLITVLRKTRYLSSQGLWCTRLKNTKVNTSLISGFFDVITLFSSNNLLTLFCLSIWRSQLQHLKGNAMLWETLIFYAATVFLAIDYQCWTYTNAFIIMKIRTPWTESYFKSFAVLRINKAQLFNMG